MRAGDFYSHNSPDRIPVHFFVILGAARKVKELIAKLHQCNQEAVVKVVSLYDGKYEPIAVVTSGPLSVMLDVSDESDSTKGYGLPVRKRRDQVKDTA